MANFTKSAKILALALAVSMPVGAQITLDEPKTTASTGEVVVSGTTTETNANVLVTVSVKDVAEDEFFSTLGYQDMIKSGADGKFTATFKMDGAELFEVTAATATESTAVDLVFADEDATKTAIGNVNTLPDVVTTLKNERYALGLYDSNMTSEPDYDRIAEFVEEAGTLDKDDVDTTKQQLAQFMVMAAIENEEVENAFAFEGTLGILKLKNNDVFTEEMFTEEHQKAATELVSGETFEDYKDFTDKLTDAMILAVVADPNGYGNVQAVLEAHEDRIGIDTSKVSDEVYKHISGDFASVGKIAEKFEELYEEYGSGFTGGFGGGGGGGSSLGGGNVSYASNPAIISPVTPITDNGVFEDLGSYQWAKESIEGLANKGIVSGKEDGKFYPQDKVTRSEFVKMLVLSLGIAGGDRSFSFDDVRATDWDYKYIKAAYGAGVVNGISENLFGGSDYITRQDMAVMIYRALEVIGKAPVEKSTVEFADNADIAGYASDNVYALKYAGIMKGDENGNFNPVNPANRAEAAMVIYSVIK